MADPRSTSGEPGEDAAHDCCHGKSAPSVDPRKLQDLQSRIDDLLAGRAKVTGTSSEENSRPFAPFLPSDKEQASLSAALYQKIAKEEGGLSGLQAAIDQMYDDLGSFPAGLVEHAAKLFLTHYGPARELLQMRSLEERQPGMVRPSRQQALTVK